MEIYQKFIFFYINLLFFFSNIIREESESKSAVNLVQAATSTAANLAAVAAKLSTTEAASLSTASPPGVTLAGSGSSSAISGSATSGPGGQSLEAVVASQLKSDPNGKDPQLMNMLYSAFQAFISKQKQQQNPQQVSYSSASNVPLPPVSSGLPSVQMAPPLPPSPPTTSATTTYSQPPLPPQHQQAPAQHHNTDVVSPPPPLPQQPHQLQQQPPPLPPNAGALSHLQGSPPMHELSHHQISSHDNNNGALLPSPPTHPAATACPTLTTHYLPFDATNQLAAAWQFSLAAASAPTHFLYPPQYLPFQTSATVGPLFSQPPMMMHPPPLLETPPPPQQTPIHFSASAELYPTAAGGKRKQSLNYFKNSYQSKKLCTGN